ncbi:MAG: YigZ family protein, partial [Bacilli bacterium]|nr:YigZ family protein [Bacilli bacterium]
MKTILIDSTNELIIKNSKFITVLKQINDNTDVNSIIDNIKKEYPKATHYCYGYITENKKKSSDDGEPGGTAGTPILNVLEKEDIINILVIVIRYFGGIKLGAGGLVRAYSKSVKEALSNTKLIELTTGYKVEIIFDYNNKKDIDYKL